MHSDASAELVGSPVVQDWIVEHKARSDELKCANCGREPRADENPYDIWRIASDGVQELHVFCPECFKREFRDSTLLNMKSPGELTASYVWGGRSRYLVRVHHRTDDAAAILQEGFRDRDYTLPGIGEMRGVLVSWPSAAFSDRDDPPDQGGEALEVTIPEELFIDHKLTDEHEDTSIDVDYTLFRGSTAVQYTRAMIPAEVLNRVTLTGFEAEISAGGVQYGSEVEVGFPGFVLDEKAVESDIRDHFRRSEQYLRLRRDIDILVVAGDIDLAQSALRALKPETQVYGGAFASSWPPEPAADLRIPDGALFGALPQVARGNVRFAFVGGPMLYFDPRGEFDCVSGDLVEEGPWAPLAEECGRVTAMVDSRDWNRVAISVTHRLLQAAQRVGDASAWAYTLGRNRRWFHEDVQALTGWPLVRARQRTGERDWPWAEPVAVALGKPALGRWLYEQNPSLLALHCIRGHNIFTVAVPPTVAIWRWPDRSDMMLQAFCDTLASPEGEPVTVVLPDTPGLRDFARRYTARQRMTNIERTLLENLLHFYIRHDEGYSVCHGRFNLTRVIESSGEELDGDVVGAALDFLDTNYQVRISPWDLVRDPLLRNHLSPRVEVLRSARADFPPWTDDERAELEEVRNRYREMKSPKWEAGGFSPHRPEPLGPP